MSVKQFKESVPIPCESKYTKPYCQKRLSNFEVILNLTVAHQIINNICCMAHKEDPSKCGHEPKQNNLPESKQRLLDKYFISSHHQFDGQFVSAIFQLAEQDSVIDQLLSEQGIRILNSKQHSAIPFLNALIAHPKHQKLALDFLTNLLQLQTDTPNQSLQKHILQELPSLLPFVINSNSKLIKSILAFLSLKMRSFDLSIRITALHSLKAVGTVAINQGGEWFKLFSQIIPRMIEKQQLVKEVSYIKGLFLQMLEDEFHEVRQITIQCLGLFRKFMRPQDLKQIIIYMLNDQHELVREEALQTAKYLTNMILNKQDLDTLLMCLREKRTNMRRLVYQNLSIIEVADASLLKLLLQKVLTTLQIYRSDKKQIYRMLLIVGKKYSNQIGKLFVSIGLGQIEQPNCKNMAYKAKMLFCYEWWKKSGREVVVPSYFIKHMLYICDVQSYLFCQSRAIVEQSLGNIDFVALKNNVPLLIRFIECQEEISQEYHKIILEVIRQLIIAENNKNILLNKIEMLPIYYKLQTDQQNITKTILELIENDSLPSTQQIIDVVKRCIQNRQKYQQTDAAVPMNKCSVSRLEPNLIVSSNSVEFIGRVYLRCWKNSLLSRLKKPEFKKLSQLSLIRSDDQNSFWSVNLSRYSSVQCILMLNKDNMKVLDSYETDHK